MAEQTLRLVIAGGGTGGHVFPALALADHLRLTSPASEVLFVGSRGGLEERLVPAQGHRLELLPVGKLRRTGRIAQLRTLATLPVAGVRALSLLRRFAPQAVVGVGGYASGPMVLAAALLRLPIVLLEQNSIPGSTNRFLARMADRVVIAYRHAARYLPADRTLLLGNPVRREILEGLRGARAPRDPRRPCLLVLGGSQGAHSLNQRMAEVAPGLAQRVAGLRVIHQTGAADEELCRETYRQAGLEAQVHAFVDDMASVYRQADVVLSRAGATTLAELCIAGLPAVLVPYPFAADDHQAENAAEIAEGGGAEVIPQGELSADRLLETLAALLGDASRREAMGRAITARAYPDAAAAITAVLAELVRRPS